MQNYNSTKSKTSFNSGLDLSLILSKQWKIFDFKNSMSPSISQLYKQILHLKENLKVSNERRNIFLPSNKRFRPDKNQSGIVSKSSVPSRFISIYSFIYLVFLQNQTKGCYYINGYDKSFLFVHPCTSQSYHTTLIAAAFLHGFRFSFVVHLDDTFNHNSHKWP